MASRIKQCYSDSNGVMHASYESAVQAQDAIDKAEAQAKKIKPIEDLLDRYNDFKSAWVRDRYRELRDHPHAARRLVSIPTHKRLSLFIEALDAEGLKVVPK